MYYIGLTKSKLTTSSENRLEERSGKVGGVEMKTFWAHQCPQCGGDLYLARFAEGLSLKCFQCAREWPVPQRRMRQQPVKIASRKPEPVEAAA